MLGEASLIPNASASCPSMAVEAPAEGRDLPASASEGSKTSRVGGLVLTRHLDESIMVGDEVEIRVAGIKSGTVRLKIIAPRSIPVHRREVFDSIRSGTGPAAPSPLASPGVARPGKPQGGLVLARLARQSIMIGEDVELEVVEVRPSTVKLRVSAPKSVAVHRLEVFEAIRDGRA
jgi:carbon storage regulator